jgi:hypothetical protein
MRSFILGIVILMAAPGYAVGQQPDRSGGSATGRTAVPRGEAVQAAPARQADRRAERRGETSTPASRGEKSTDAASSHAGRERRGAPNADETVAARVREERLRAASARAYPTMSPPTPRPPSFRPDHGSAATPRPPSFRPGHGSAATPRPPSFQPGHGSQPLPNREHRRPGQRDGDYRPRYRRPHGGANVVFVPYAAPVVVEREIVVEREVVDETAVAPAIVEHPAPARLILDINPPTAQVFADGYYIGIPEDFRFEDGGAVLEPGPHRIDILHRDYEPVSFDVNLTRGQSATFRRTLTPIVRAQPAPDATVKTQPAPKQPVTFYLIPGCYIGNVPPKDANLPATCDIKRVVSTQY